VKDACRETQIQAGKEKNACRETQTHAGKWAQALIFVGEFSKCGSDKAKENFKKLWFDFFVCERHNP
jgi:hypothetical protein